MTSATIEAVTMSPCGRVDPRWEATRPRPRLDLGVGLDGEVATRTLGLRAIRNSDTTDYVSRRG